MLQYRHSSIPLPRGIGKSYCAEVFMLSARSRFSISSGYVLRSLALLIALFMAPFGFAQTQAINGSIRGHVTDAAGAAVPGAKITILNGDTGFTRRLDTGDDGLFVFPNLPLGVWTVTIQKDGFSTQKHTGIVLDAGTDGVIDASLQVGSVATT